MCKGDVLTRQSYISYRQSYIHSPTKRTKYAAASGNGYSDPIGGASDERRGLMSSGAFEDGDAVIEMDLLPPRWADISDEVTEFLADIATKSSTLEKLHQKHVLPGFNDEEEKRREERDRAADARYHKGLSRLPKGNSEGGNDGPGVYTARDYLKRRGNHGPEYPNIPGGASTGSVCGI